MITSSGPHGNSTGFEVFEAWTLYVLLAVFVLLAATALSHFLVKANCSRMKKWLAAHIQMTAIWGAIIVFFFADSVLDYDRCPVRKWLGSGLAATTLLTAAGLLIYHRKGIRVGLGIGLVTVGIIQLLLMPQKDHAFRAGLTGLPVTLVATACSFPEVDPNDWTGLWLN